MKVLLVLSILLSTNTFAAIQSDESKAKACLGAAAVLQKVFYKNHGYYTENVNRLDWGTEECLETFDFSMISNDESYSIEVKNQKAAWKIDHKDQVTKL